MTKIKTIPTPETKGRSVTLLEYVTHSAWAMLPSVMDQLGQVITRHVSGEKLSAAVVANIVSARESRTEETTASLSAGELGATTEIVATEAGYDLIGSVARIVIGGVIAKRSSMVNGASQPRGTAVDTLRLQLESALTDDRVGSILFHVESPGGTVSGLSKLAEDIRSATKPTVAFVDGLAASAGLWLASQADRVEATRDSSIGSIGVYTFVVDQSRQYENAGIRVMVAQSNEGKADGLKGTAVTEGLMKELQEGVEAFHTQFLEDLATGREMTPQAIRDLGRTRVWLATEALQLGLIDAIADDVRDTIAAMNEQHTPPRVRRDLVGPTSRADITHQTPKAGDEGRPTMGDTDKGTAAPTAAPAVDTNAIQAAALKAERERVAALDAKAASLRALAGSNALIVDTALASAKAGDITPEQFASNVIDDITKVQGPTGHAPSGTPVGMGDDQRDKITSALQLAMVSKVAPQAVSTITNRTENAARVASSLGFRTVDEAANALHDLRGSHLRKGSLQSTVKHLLAAQYGVSVSDIESRYSSDEELFKAAVHTTSDFPALLSNVMNKSLSVYAMEVQTFWQQIARRGTSTDFKARKIVTVSGENDLLTVAEGDSPELGSFDDRGEDLAVDPQARDYALTYQMFKNDDLGVLANNLRLVSRSGVRRPDQMVAALLAQNSGNGPTMSDGVNMFNAAHNNLASASALNYANLKAAVTAMRALKDFNSRKPNEIEVEPRVLLTGTEISMTAQDLTTQEYAPGSTGANNEKNVFRNMLEAVYSQRLSGISATRWWLFADPADVAALEVSFLDGIDTPQIHMHEGGHPLQQRFTALIPGIGVSAVNYEGAYSNPGA